MKLLMPSEGITLPFRFRRGYNLSLHIFMVLLIHALGERHLAHLSCSTIREVVVLCCVCIHQSCVQALCLVLQPQALSDVLQHFFQPLAKILLKHEVKHITMLQYPQHRHIYIILSKMKL